MYRCIRAVHNVYWAWRSTFIEFVAEYIRKIRVSCQTPLGDGQVGLLHWKLWMRYRVLCSSWKWKTLPLPLKGQWWYPLTKQDIEISTDIAALLCLRPRLSKRLTRFLLFHNQLLIINSNQWKSIKLRRIGEWLYSIFIDWLSQSISINRFLLIMLIEINDWFSLIYIV